MGSHQDLHLLRVTSGLSSKAPPESPIHPNAHPSAPPTYPTRASGESSYLTCITHSPVQEGNAMIAITLLVGILFWIGVDIWAGTSSRWYSAVKLNPNMFSCLFTAKSTTCRTLASSRTMAGASSSAPHRANPPTSTRNWRQSPNDTGFGSSKAPTLHAPPDASEAPAASPETL